MLKITKNGTTYTFSITNSHVLEDGLYIESKTATGDSGELVFKPLKDTFDKVAVKKAIELERVKQPKEHPHQLHFFTDDTTSRFSLDCVNTIP